MTLTTRLITDYDCILTAELVSIKGNFATVIVDKEQKKVKIYTSFDGSKYILPYGKYSMCPSFKIPNI